MDYTRLTADRQKDMLEQRATNLETEHFNNAVTLKTLQAAAGHKPNPADQTEIDRLNKNLTIIDAAHAAVEKELANFPVDTDSSNAKK